MKKFITVQLYTTVKTLTDRHMKPKTSNNLQQTYFYSINIRLRVDDYEDEKIDISDAEAELPLMTTSYRVFIGGVPQDTVFPHAASGSEQPFIGCVRDVLIDKEVRSRVFSNRLLFSFKVRKSYL